MPELQLKGCRSRPLIGYLKALGILRTLSRQLPEETRARWSGGTFQLAGGLDRDALIDFFLHRYEPSVVLSPWNGGSGFYPEGNTTAVKALERLRDCADARFESYAAAIVQTQRLLSERGLAKAPKDDQKAMIVRDLRRFWPDDVLEWLDSALVLAAGDLQYPPLLGSGGNDGRMDISSNFMQSLGAMLLGGEDPKVRSCLAGALFATRAILERDKSLAHFDREASPSNSPNGEVKGMANPWDLILAVEGTLMLRPGAARRHAADGLGMLVAPFTVRATAAGYGSAVAGEKGRAELWLPLWSGWATAGEFELLAREGRAEVRSGSTRRNASSGLDFARAAGTLGVSRGISAFERYSILERAGESNMAVAAGQVAVVERPATRLLAELDRWLTSVRIFADDKDCPQAVRAALAKVARASYHLAASDGPRNACQLLVAIGEAEVHLARSGRVCDSTLRPVGKRINAEPWIVAADDGSPEFALALSLASLREGRAAHGVESSGGGQEVGGSSLGRLPALRDYIFGTLGGGKEYDKQRRELVAASTLASIGAAIHSRRQMQQVASGRRSQTSNAVVAVDDGSSFSGGDQRPRRALGFDVGLACPLDVARLLVAGRLDESRALALVRGLALLDFGSVQKPKRDGTWIAPPQPMFEVLTLAWNPRSLSSLALESERKLGPSPGMASRLAAGAIEPVVGDALLRLQLAGIPAIAQAGDLLGGIVDRRRLGERLATALMLKYDQHELRRLARRVLLLESEDQDKVLRKETA